MKKVDIIWNMTRVCMWDCSICCVDAVHVRSDKNSIQIKDKSLSRLREIPKQTGSSFEQAQKYLQECGEELFLDEKFQVLENLKGFDTKIDFSGGDPLASSETFILMKKAKELFGQHNITLTSTGPGLKRADPEILCDLVGELNFTFDQPPTNLQIVRPDGYNASNLFQIQKLIKRGIKIRAETPLTIKNCHPDVLEEIYLQLHNTGVQKHLIMRFFPVGRAEGLTHLQPNIDQIRMAVEKLRTLEERYGYPKIRLQCALKYLENKNLMENPCDAGGTSFGLTADGTLLISPWAINRLGEPLNTDWVIGSLSKSKLSEILATEKYQEFLQNCNRNFGHCKIHAYIHAKEKKFMAMFEARDPLYEKSLTNSSKV
jgi:MoaA/NifB/PqqE/SkfB family radical SAM enzyme